MNRIDNEWYLLNEILAEAKNRHIDIAPTYNDWIHLGYALCTAFGEGGRQAFLDFSHEHAGEQKDDPNRQYDQCLTSGRGEVGFGTVVHLARQAGIEAGPSPIPPRLQPAAATSPISPISPVSPISPEGGERLMLTAAEAEQALQRIADYGWPTLLLRSMRLVKGVYEQGMVLLSALTCISSTLKFRLQYDGVSTFLNLFLFVVADAGTGKGRMKLGQLLTEGVHRQLRERSRELEKSYQAEKAEWEARSKSERGTPPQQPPQLMLYVPANCTHTAVLQTLVENDGQLLLFATEADELSDSFKSEHGDYSVTLRRAFHNESVSYKRRQENEYKELTEPHLAVCISGTPAQVQRLIPDEEDGLFSRFSFFTLKAAPQWRNVFADSEGPGIDQQASELGRLYTAFHDWLEQQHPKFVLTEQQQQRFNRHFEQLQQEYHQAMPNGFDCCIFRTGLTAFRMVMIIALLRIMDTPYAGTRLEQVCVSDDDLEMVLLLARVLLHHTSEVFKQYHPDGCTDSNCTQQLAEFLQSLPAEFNRQGYLAAARKLGIPDKTAEKHIDKLMRQSALERWAHNQYRKVI